MHSCNSLTLERFLVSNRAELDLFRLPSLLFNKEQSIVINRRQEDIDFLDPGEPRQRRYWLIPHNSKSLHRLARLTIESADLT